MKNHLTQSLIMNHDLRNNIGASISHLQLMLIDNPDLLNNEDMLAAIENLKQSINISKSISVNLSNSSETEQLKTTLEKISCHDHFFKNAKPAYEKLNKMYPITIRDSYITTKDDKAVFANQAAIASLRENIINNAIKSGATELDISLEMREYCLVVIFKDNGLGMSQDEIDKIHLKQHGDGIIHGIGTSSIMSTVEEGDGAYINFSSKINEGTTIRIVIPYAE